jgi:hypothetical protein
VVENISVRGRGSTPVTTAAAVATAATATITTVAAATTATLAAAFVAAATAAFVATAAATFVAATAATLVAAATTFVAAATTTAGTGLTGFRCIDAQRTALIVLVVQSGNRRIGSRHFAHRNKCKTTRAARFTIGDDFHAFHRTVGTEELGDLIFSSGEGQIAHIDIHNCNCNKNTLF